MKKLRAFLFYGLIIALAAGAGPAFSGVWQWSKTADSNAGADPSINWAEGMSPSSVNDSARAMMAQIANWRDDISGLLLTGGTATAYTVTSNSGYCSSSSTPNDGQAIAITVNSTNGASPTLALDSCTAAPIQSSAGNAVASATLVSGSPYKLKYSVANTAWMLEGFYSSATNIALGMLAPYTLTSSPNSNFVIAAGQCLSTITYVTYWNALGSPGPGSCGANQFAIIDMSGSIPAGLDTMPGFGAAGRLTSSASGCGTAFTSVGTRCANGNQSKTIGVTNIPSGIPVSVSGTITVTSNNSNIVHDPGIISSNAGGGATKQLSASASSIAETSSGSNSMTGTASGSGTAISNVPPVVGVTYLLRVL
jgi:hypothetical protein